MSLPHFNASTSPVMSDPVYSNLYEVKCNDIDQTILDEARSYSIDTTKGELEIEFNTNEDTLAKYRDHNLQTNRIDIILRNREGKVLRKMFFYDLEHIGFKTSGSWDSNDLVFIKHVWRFKGNTVIDLVDLENS